MRIFFYIFALLTLGVIPSAKAFVCTEDLRLMMEQIQLSIVGRGKPKIPQEILPAHLTDMRTLENDLLDLIVTPVGLRNSLRERLAKKHELSVENLRDLELFLAIAYFNEPRLYSADSREVMARVRHLERAFRLTDPHSSLAKRHLAYLLHLTQLSVPELAVKMGRTEADVYRDLYMLGISIEDEFSQPISSRNWSALVHDLQGQGKGSLVSKLDATNALATAQVLAENGFSSSQSAKMLGFGAQALDFILHYKHETNRGVRWNREISLPAGPIGEEALVKDLYRQGTKIQRIADIINEATKTSHDHPDYRTAASVYAKIRVLLPKPPRLSPYPDDVRNPEKPSVFLKLNGQLQEENLIDYLSRHLATPIAWIAEDLNIPPSTLSDFAKIHNIPLGRFRKSPMPATSGFSPSSRLKSNEILDEYDRAWIRHKEETLPIFMDREKGALIALGEIDGFAGGPSVSTADALIRAFPHVFESQALAEKVKARVTNSKAGDGAKHQKGTAQQVQDAFYWICEAHNERVANTREGTVIDLGTIHTNEGARRALFALRQRISELHPDRTHILADEESGGLTALTNIEGFVGRDKVSNYSTAEAMIQIAPHLANDHELHEKIRTRITDKAAGASAHRKPIVGQNGATQQVLDSFYWICEAHNAWVVKHPGRGLPIDLETIHTREGATKALFALRGRISEFSPERTDAFGDIGSGGVGALRTIEGFNGGGNATTAEAMLRSFPHLADNRELHERVKARVTNKTAGEAATTGKHIRNQKVAARQLHDAFYWICEAHNEWVASHPEKGVAINLDAIHTVEGARKALYALRNRISDLYPDRADIFWDRESGGIAAINGIQGFHGGGKNSTADALIQSVPHLSENYELQKQLRDRVPKTAGNAAFSSPAPNASSRQLYDAFYWICEAHNSWQKNNPGKADAIDLDTIHTLEGARKAMFALRGRITELHPERLDAFMNLESGGIAVLLQIEGFSGERGYSTAEAMMRKVPHLSADKDLQEKILTRLASKKAGSLAKRPHHIGFRGANETIQDAFYWMSEAHNKWVIENKKGNLIDLDSVHTAEGARAALKAFDSVN